MLKYLRFHIFKEKNVLPVRTFKNFGHKREPIPFVTTLWHGFLTVTFIGLGLKWDVISNLLFGTHDYDEEIEKSMVMKNKHDS